MPSPIPVPLWLKKAEIPKHTQAISVWSIKYAANKRKSGRASGDSPITLIQAAVTAMTKRFTMKHNLSGN